jgi:CO/xanthine dehydrogenase FAD-binding subunit
VGVAVLVTLDDRGRVKATRIVYLGVGEKPTVSQQAAQVLLGQEPGAEAIRAAADAGAKSVDPGADIHGSADYRRFLINNLTRQALTTAVERARKVK